MTATDDMLKAVLEAEFRRDLIEMVDMLVAHNIDPNVLDDYPPATRDLLRRWMRWSKLLEEHR